jgi:hypothetical protein
MEMDSFKSGKKLWKKLPVENILYVFTLEESLKNSQYKEKARK